MWEFLQKYSKGAYQTEFAQIFKEIEFSFEQLKLFEGEQTLLNERAVHPNHLTEVSEEFLNQYRDSHKALERFCAALCKDREASRELIQETLLQAIQAYPKIRDKEKFSSWIMGIAIRVKRANERKWKRIVFPETIPETIGSNQTDHDASLSILRRLVAKLKPKEQEAFLLFELSDFSLEAIAEIQESNLNTVKTRLRRAREKLKSWLQSEYRLDESLDKWSLISEKMEVKNEE